MNLLLDTHVLLWWLEDNPRLSESTRNLISSVNNVIVVSAVSIWEIRIKQSLGKLIIASDFFDVIKQEGFELLSITSNHADQIGSLPQHHRDPFDRMLITQAIMENLTIVTHDKIFDQYNVPLIGV